MADDKPRHWYQVPAFFQPLLFGALVVLISLLFPTNLRFKYEYALKQPWVYEDLYAPYPFAILKTDKEIEQERAAILDARTPVYVRNEEVRQRQQAVFKASFDTLLQQVRDQGQFKDVSAKASAYREYALAFLERLYNRGIVSLRPEDEQLPTETVLHIIKGNHVEQQTVDNLLTLEDAHALISDSLPYSGLAEPEFLLPLLLQNISPNLLYNEERTVQLQDGDINAISSTRGVAHKGQLLVQKGQLVTDEIYQLLHSFEEEHGRQVMSKGTHLGVYLGYLLMLTVVVTVFAIYMRRYAKLVYSRLPKLIFVLMWPLLFSYLIYLVDKSEGINAYIIPFCVAPIIIKIFYKGDLALFTHIVIILITSMLRPLGYEFVLIQLLGGIVVVISRIDTRDWTAFFYVLLSVFTTQAVSYIGLSMLRLGNLQELDTDVLAWLFLGNFLTLLAFPLVPLMERLFGFLSPLTLVELTDMNKPLLRELALKAPGTLQHSLQVGNLAEAAAQRINADALLVKVGALYHDIGKTKNPAYFIENQTVRSPHKDKDPLESAEIIIRHVPDGVEMAKKAGLPQQIISFIQSHHGNTRVEYFYRLYAQFHEVDEQTELLFHYPGMRPHSKEETILMLADSIEAACKSLKNPTEEDLYQTIDNIFSLKISGGQLRDSALCFRELEACRAAFRQVISGIYHQRISYPPAQHTLFDQEEE